MDGQDAASDELIHSMLSRIGLEEAPRVGQEASPWLGTGSLSTLRARSSFAAPLLLQSEATADATQEGVAPERMAYLHHPSRFPFTPGMDSNNLLSTTQPRVQFAGTSRPEFSGDGAVFFASSRPSVGSLSLLKKFGGTGRGPGEFQSPHGFCLGLGDAIVVADTENHRIQVFCKNGFYKFEFGRQGREDGLLWKPRKVGVLRRNGFFVVCDIGKERSRLQIFNEKGQFEKRFEIGYIQIVSALAITSQDYIALVDSVRLVIYILDQFRGEVLNVIDLRGKVSEPSDLTIYQDHFYICDFKGHRVCHLDAKGDLLGYISSERISKYPNGIDVSDKGDILISDSHGNFLHIAVFNSQKQFLSQNECKDIKVSRCCGLRILSDGHFVTLSKNNNNILIMDTLYV